MRVVDTPDDQQRVYRLRYEVYVEEMRRTQAHADHGRRRIEEPLDASGLVLAAFDGHDVVGTVRGNYARSADLGFYAALYAMDAVGAEHPARTSITTKLLVSPRYRQEGLAVLLLEALFARGLQDGIRFNFIDCNQARVELFQRLGCRIHRNAVQHPEYGEVVCMVLDLLDRDHLRSIGSPLAHVLERHLRAANGPPRTVMGAESCQP